MRTYPIPFNEEARLRAVCAVPGLTEENESIFDAICDATRKLLGCPIAHISVVEESTQWYKSVVGYELERMPKDNSFCTHTIMSDDPMVIPDLSKDPRFKQHPMVAEGGPGARFYAGVPLVLSSGYRFGSLCGLDLVPHDAPSDQQMSILADLGKAVVAALERAPAKLVEETEDEAAKKTFIALVGHELRTPLTILSSSVQVLEMMADRGVDRSLTRSVRKSTQHLMSLVETIITFSDASTGELRLNESNCELGDLVAQTATLELPGADGTLKTISIADGSTSLMAQVDPDQIELTINALALNAVNHGGADIRVGCGQDASGNIEIWVSDNGCLDENVELAELYKPFVVGGVFRNRDTRGGLGLGLPLTRKIVELHGGDFEVQALPDRTTAIIRLPSWREEIAR